jgi:hypothetical protein
MVTNDQSIEVPLALQSAREIEHFVDTICDQLFINDAYYGNILISVTTFFEELLRKPASKSVILTYHTDHQSVRVSFQPVDNQFVKLLEKKGESSEDIGNESDRLNFLLHTLVDHVEFDDSDKVTLEFDISALHNRVFEHRQNQLSAYFNHTIEEQVKKKDDQL